TESLEFGRSFLRLGSRLIIKLCRPDSDRSEFHRQGVHNVAPFVRELTQECLPLTMLTVSSLPNDSGKGRRDLFKRATDGRLMDKGYGFESGSRICEAPAMPLRVPVIAPEMYLSLFRYR